MQKIYRLCPLGVHRLTYSEGVLSGGGSPYQIIKCLKRLEKHQSVSFNDGGRYPDVIERD